MMHYAGIGRICEAWKDGHKETIDWNHVDCEECRVHLTAGDNGGTNAVVHGRECAVCGGSIKEVDDGDTARCACCGIEFLCVVYKVMHPIVPDDEAVEQMVSRAKDVASKCSPGDETHAVADDLVSLAAELNRVRGILKRKEQP